MANVQVHRNDLLGAHVSVAGGVARAPGRASALPAYAFQIFTKNQNQWRGKPLTTANVAAWRTELSRHGLSARHVCSHDSYLINLAATDRTNLRRSRTAFTDEIERCARLAIPYLVFHPGSHLGRGETKGLAAVARNIDHCLESAGASSVSGTEEVLLCIETTAGQGTNLGYRFEHLRDIIGASKYPDRLAACVDTCHIFAAGYRLATPHQIQRTLADFESAVGLNRIRVMHLNDSRRECGSRVDRHARIGRGEIGAEPFRTLLRARRLRHAIKVLEVPGGDEAYQEDLALLRRLVRREAGP
jgi:deoxyribonuclease-4